MDWVLHGAAASSGEQTQNSPKRKLWFQKRHHLLQFKHESGVHWLEPTGPALNLHQCDWVQHHAWERGKGHGLLFYSILCFTKGRELWILRFPGLQQSQACAQATPIRPAATTRKSEQLLGLRALRGLFFIPPEFVLLFKIIKQLSLPEKKANYPSRWHCPSTFRHAGGVAAAWVLSQQGEASGSAPRCCWERSSNPKPAEPGCLPPLPKGSASNIEMLIWLCKPINKNKEEDTRGKKPPWTPCPNPISSIQALSDGAGFCPQEWVPQALISKLLKRSIFMVRCV